MEPLLQRVAELRDPRHRHVREAHLLRRPEERVGRIRVRRPRIELQVRRELREQEREVRRRDRVVPGRACRPVATPVRRLADGDERARVSPLDAGVRRLVELQIGRDAHDLAAGELRRQEEAEVRLVPDRPARDEAALGGPVVALREHLRELGQRPQAGWVVRRLAAVRPLRRAGDVDHHLQPVAAGVGDERVEVGDAVGGIVAVERRGGLRRRDLRPVGSDMDDRGACLLCREQVLRGVRRPPEAVVVVEADQHPRRCGRARHGEQQGDDGESDHPHE